MRSTFILFLLLSVFDSTLSAQQAAPTPASLSPAAIADLKKIQAAAIKSSYAYDQTGYLANNIGPRLSGSPQAARAIEYVADELRKLNLEVRLQKIMVPHWVRGEEKAELVSFPGMAPGTTQKVVITALGGSVATPPEGITADIVVVNSFEELNALGRTYVEGKVVLFNNKFDRDMAASGFGLNAYGQAVQYRGGGPSAASRLGAVAVLVRSAGASQNRLAHTGATRYADGVAKVPAAAVTSEDADTIAFLSRQGRVRLHLLLTPKTLPDAPSYNVIADLKGSEKPNEIVIVSGHLDSWDLGTGAIDDACGVATAMQVPFLLKQLGLRPKRTIRVIAWMNEESGTAGGRAYAAEEAANMADHMAAIESDLGASHPVGFLFAGKPGGLTLLAPVSEVLKTQGAGISRIEDEVGTDIGPLTRAGVPSFAPWFDTRTYFNYHHTAADTFDKIDPKELAEGGSVVAVLAYALANLDRPLPR
ncbi:MAG: M20/M25/M40 family metallo-hydrolase [Acidobacteriota bacterium]